MPPDNAQNPVLGIDLGTTFSSIARWTGRGTEVYQMHTGETELQSAVYYNPGTKETLVGKLAYKKGLLEPDNLALGVKRKMDDNSQKIAIGGRDFSPVDLSSEILRYLYRNVEEKFPRGIFRSRGTVVTVPYYFKAHQCENTRKAAEKADIQCLGILQEPIAASLQYAWDLVTEYPDEEREETVLVFDLGGGTLDLTLFKLRLMNEKLLFEVLASGGDDRLGGMDFDRCLAELLLEIAGLSLDDLPGMEKRRAWQRLIEQAILAKETLSVTKEWYVGINNLVGEKHLDLTVKKEQFEECITEYQDKVRDILRQLWVTAKLRPEDVDRIVRVGGSSKIPCMQDILRDAIGEEKMYAPKNELTAVAEGAALYAAYLDDPEVFGREIEVTTRTCHALGVEVMGGRFFVIIPPNRKAPCTSSHWFAKPELHVTSLDINVYQGTNRAVKNNSLIGTIKVRDLPPRQVDIKVTFSVSGDQKLSVRTEYEGKEVQNIFTMQ